MAQASGHEHNSCGFLHNLHAPHLSGFGHADHHRDMHKDEQAMMGNFQQQTRNEKNTITHLTWGTSGKAKLLTYDLEKLVRIGGILAIFTKGTIFTLDSGIVQQFVEITLGFSGIALAMWFLIDGPENIRTIETANLEQLSSYLGGFVPFVLGLYVSLALSRWWTLRVQALGNVFDAAANVSMLVCCHLPAKQFSVVRKSTVKWALASVVLLIKAARDDDRIDDMVSKGYLTDVEVHAISTTSPYGRAMVMWAWIMRLTQETFQSASGPPPHSPKWMMVAGTCLKARDGIQTIHTYLRTQLPFAYVHLLTLLVNLHNVVFTCKCSVVFMVSLCSEPQQIQKAAYQVMMMFLIPVCYQGLLTISYVIHDPFGEDLLDFPVAAYAEYVSHSCSSTMLAQHSFPSGPDDVPELIGNVPNHMNVSAKDGQDKDVLSLKEVGEQLARMAKLLDCLPGAVTQLEEIHGAANAKEKCRTAYEERLVQVFSEVNQQSTPIRNDNSLGGHPAMLRSSPQDAEPLFSRFQPDR